MSSEYLVKSFSAKSLYRKRKQKQFNSCLTLNSDDNEHREEKTLKIWTFKRGLTFYWWIKKKWSYLYFSIFRNYGHRIATWRLKWTKKEKKTVLLQNDRNEHFKLVSYFKAGLVSGSHHNLSSTFNYFMWHVT